MYILCGSFSKTDARLYSLLLEFEELSSYHVSAKKHPKTHQQKY